MHFRPFSVKKKYPIFSHFGHLAAFSDFFTDFFYDLLNIWLLPPKTTQIRKKSVKTADIFKTKRDRALQIVLIKRAVNLT